jgi:hypothetical protein
MTRALICNELRLVAPDLAVGTISGAERAAALAHLADCRTCRHEVEGLTELADRLLLLAPEDEPSPGFETRVMSALADAGMGETAWRRYERSQARRKVRRMLAAAAAVVALLGSAAVGAWDVRRTDRHSLALTAEYVSVLQKLGGSSLRAATLQKSDGSRVGQVFVYDGNPSWIFVTVDHADDDGSYTVEVSGPTSGPWLVPGLDVKDGHGALGHTAGSDVRLLTEISVTDADGQDHYTAHLDHGRV